MTKATLVALLMKMLAAVNAGDAKRYAALYEPDGVIRMIGSGDLLGRDAIERHEVELLREYPGTRLAFYSAWQQGSAAVVRYGVNGRTAAGQPMGHEGLLFFRFGAAGLIAEERRYLDSLTPMAQLGAFGLKAGRGLPALPRDMTASDAPADPDAITLARQILAACDARDAAAFLTTLSDDVVVDDVAGRTPLEGKAAAARWLAEWSAAVPDTATEIASIAAVGSAVLVETVVRGTLRGPLGLLEGTGRAFAIHRALVMEFAAGKLARLSVFMNTKELAEATGQWPPRPK
jgi:steroid delta-isomerase-like uncharacterized protein